jgi:hypothetical protein
LGFYIHDKNVFTQVQHINSRYTPFYRKKSKIDVGRKNYHQESPRLLITALFKGFGSLLGLLADGAELRKEQQALGVVALLLHISKHATEELEKVTICP